MDFIETVTLKVPDLSDAPAVQEASVGVTSGLLVEFAAIHSGVTDNFNNYTERALKRSLASWTDPYPKPLIMNHDIHADPIGRVMKARMAKEVDGTPYVSLQIVVTDNEAAEKLLDGRYLTGSVGGKALKATCSICEADWAKASMFELPCDHRRGRKYEGKLATIDMQEIKFVEFSVVNSPADSNAIVRSISPASDEDLKKIKQADVFHLDAEAEQLTNLAESTSPVPSSLLATTEVVELFNHANAIAEAHDKQDMREHRKQELKQLMREHPMDDGICEKRDCESEEKDPKKPYGDVVYADPGHQKDGVKRYPLDTCAHTRSALSYISMSKNANKYTSSQLKRIKSRIKKAAKQCGIDVSDDEAIMSKINQEQNSPEETDDDVLAAVDGLNGVSIHKSTESSDEGEEEDETAEANEDVDAESEESVEDDSEDSEDTETLDDSDEDSEESDSDEEPVSEDSEEEASDSGEGEGDSESQETDESAEPDESQESDGSAYEDLTEAEHTIAALREENSNLRSTLKRMLAERVVDAKVSLGVVSGEQYEEEVGKHVDRSASSLADTLRDLATWPAPAQSTSASTVPPQEDGPAPVSDGDEHVVTVGGDELIEEEDQPSNTDLAIQRLTDLMNGRARVR